MRTRRKEAVPNHISDSYSTESIRAYLGAEFMAQAPDWGGAGAAHCPHCDHLWKRALDSLQATLPAQHFQTVSRTFREVWQADQGIVDDVRGRREERQFELVLSHDCGAVACTDPNCALCCNSTSRRCADLLLPKYLVRDPLVPACGAPAAVKIQRRGEHGTSAGDLTESDYKQLPEFILQVCSSVTINVQSLE
jgi:hypothetical protein